MLYCVCSSQDIPPHFCSRCDRAVWFSNQFINVGESFQLQNMEISCIDSCSIVYQGKRDELRSLNSKIMQEKQEADEIWYLRFFIFSFAALKVKEYRVNPDATQKRIEHFGTSTAFFFGLRSEMQLRSFSRHSYWVSDTNTCRSISAAASFQSEHHSIECSISIHRVFSAQSTFCTLFHTSSSWEVHFLLFHVHKRFFQLLCRVFSIFRSISLS